MLFNSLHFLTFFPIVLAAYFSIPQRWKWLLLLSASCYFYMVFIPKYILVLFALILIDYTAGIIIERAQGRRRKRWLAASLIANIGLLGFFKYFNFASANLAAFFSALHCGFVIPNLDVALPLGLSFHTFQSMSYTIEVYRGAQKAERHLGMYALYVLFFPQLVAGPIERPQNLLHQFYERREFDYQDAADGFKRIVWGLFKKTVIADRLAVFVNEVYGNSGAYNGAALIVATYLFALQIYCDFSGYTDIALGVARTMRFKLGENFNRPYFSRSIGEFWKSWHISLTTWFFDYVYSALPWRWYASLLFVFLLSGLWHGANWTFVLWGAMHGFYMVVSILTRETRRRMVAFLHLDRAPVLRKTWQQLATFHLVALAYVPFRAKSLSETWAIMVKIFNFSDWRLPLHFKSDITGLWIALAAALLLGCIERAQRDAWGSISFPGKPPIRWVVYFAMVLIVVCLGKFEAQSFVYFQF